MTALTLSWCWDLPDPGKAPPEPPPPPPPPEPSVAERIVHLLFDRLRDFPDAYRAMQTTLREWREQHQLALRR